MLAIPSASWSTWAVAAQVSVGTTTSMTARSRDWTITGTAVLWRPAVSSSTYSPESPPGAVSSTGWRGPSRPFATGLVVPTRRSRQR